MIDADGYRPNVGIIVLHPSEPGRVLWAKRVGQQAWQFPQGGIKRGEQPQEACFRELQEELGLERQHVELLAHTEGWLKYRLPKHLVRRGRKPACIGQKQVWFLLRLQAAESQVRFDCGLTPEFDHWKWVDYWRPVEEVIAFKREVYVAALEQLQSRAGAPPRPAVSPGG